MSVFEVIHFVEHADGGLQERISAQGACTFTEAQSYLEQSAGMQGFEHPPVSGLVAFVAEHGIVAYGRIKP